MADDAFTPILDLVVHMCEELVDDPKLLDIQGTHVGITGVIQITGPSDEIAKIIGAKRATITSVETVLNAVSSKHGFKVLLNVMNNERKKYLEDGRSFDDERDK